MEQKNFVLHGKSYTVRKLGSGRYDILDNETKSVANNMKGIARDYLTRFDIRIGTKGFHTYKVLALLMEKI